MDEERNKEIQRWITKSLHDLGTVRLILESDELYLDVAVYHCQQAAEKAIKAYMIYKDIVFEKTHNLTSLLADCIPLDFRFKQWEEVAEILTPYGVAFRYPRDNMDPEEDEAQEAFISAKAFVEFIIEILPNEAIP